MKTKDHSEQNIHIWKPITKHNVSQSFCFILLLQCTSETADSVSKSKTIIRYDKNGTSEKKIILIYLSLKIMFIRFCVSYLVKRNPGMFSETEF